MLRARMFRSKDLKTIRRVLANCYLGDWWVLYQIGRNSNTHFFRYLLRHIELCIYGGNNGVLVSKKDKKRRQVKHRRDPPSSEEDVDEEDEEEVSGNGHENGSGTLRKRQKIAMPYTV